MLSKAGPAGAGGGASGEATELIYLREMLAVAQSLMQHEGFAGRMVSRRGESYHLQTCAAQ